MRKLVSALLGTAAFAAVAGTPVALEWSQPAPLADGSGVEAVAVARAAGGFLDDGRFVVAGGAWYTDDKGYTSDVWVRSEDGAWTKAGELNAPWAEGPTCETTEGIFLAGGKPSPEAESVAAKIVTIGDDGKVVETALPDLPETAVMGSAASYRKNGDNEFVYVQTGNRVYFLNIKKTDEGWQKLPDLPGPAARSQAVAAVQNGDQKFVYLVVFGGFDDAEKSNVLSDGYRMPLNSADPPAWKALKPLEGATTIGAAFMPSGNQHILLMGGYGLEGWKIKQRAASLEAAVKAGTASEEEKDFFNEWNPCIDAGKLGWQRTVKAYNAVTDAWCDYGEIAEGDFPRCGAVASIKAGKTPEDYKIVIAGGERAPKTRTPLVTNGSFRKVVKFGATAWIVVGVYALLMVGMACFFIFKKKYENDYFRGGNRIPWYVAGMSIFATMLSSITFIAIPTQAYLQDWRYFVMAFFIIGMAPVAIYYYLPFFCRLGITSAYEYLEKRFNLGVRLFGSAAFVVFMVCRVAVVTLLPAIALNAVTGISIDACILICGILTMIYCSLGGLEAVIWSDFVQGIVLMGGAVSVLVLLIMKTGPDGAHFSTFLSVADEYGKTKMWDFRFLLTEPVFWVVAVQGLISNLSSYTSDQCVIQRYIATPDENATKRSLWFNGCMSVFAQIVFYGIGMALFAFYNTHPEAMDVTMPKGDSVLPIFMATQMPPWLAGLVIAAVFAATISTLSANLSSASTAVVTDFIKRFKPNIPGKTQIRCGQVCTYVVGIIGIMAALTLARMESSALFDNFNKYIAMLTAGLTGLFFMGVFMPRIKGIAAVLGLAANYFVCFSCEIMGCDVFGLKFHPFLLGGIGLVVCVLVALIASFIFTKDGKDLTGLTLKTLKKA